ncbi:uncharacterized protein LOC118437266 [Folsomia candida]|uniref:uncharacterized protein LOC118437266 n=1 Tax=Folsomia candida TaxID=158441 RepID=UPI0016055289|nr:uncharacterized protein LOC118437266 [Folsomia candida]
MVPSTLVAPFIQLVITAAPNLTKVTLSWGFFPNFVNSKYLDSLTIAVDHMEQKHLTHIALSELSRILDQVSFRLVSLFFVNLNPFLKQEQDCVVSDSEFQLLRKILPKLRNFRNELPQIFLSEDIQGNLTALKTLMIGNHSITPQELYFFSLPFPLIWSVIGLQNPF